MSDSTSLPPGVEGMTLLAKRGNHLMDAICEAIGECLQSRKFNAILVVGHADISSYFGAYIARDEGRKLLQDLLARWDLGIDSEPGARPDELGKRRMPAFEYLLEQFEQAQREGNDVNVRAYRSEMIDFVARLAEAT